MKLLKTVALILAIVIATLHAIAQPNVSFSPLIQHDMKTSIVKPNYNSIGELIAMRINATMFHAIKYDDKGKIVAKASFHYPSINVVSGSAPYYRDCFFYADKACILSMQNSEPNEEFYIGLTYINTITMKREETVHLATIPYLRAGFLEWPKVAISPDGKKLAVAHNIGDQETRIDFKVTVFDENVKKISETIKKDTGPNFWKRRVIDTNPSGYKKAPWKAIYNTKSNMFVNNAGVVFYLLKLVDEGVFVAKSGKKKKNAKWSNSYEVTTLNNGSVSTGTMTFPCKNATGSRIIASRDNKSLIAGGYYSSEYHGMTGGFVVKYDAVNHKPIFSTADEYSTDFIRKFLSKGERKTLDKKTAKGEAFPLYAYLVNRVVESESGQIRVLGEQFTEKSFSYTKVYFEGGIGSRITKTRDKSYESYFYGPALIHSYSVTGEYQWKTPIFKNQTAKGEVGYYLSYAFIDRGNEVNVVYTAYPKNLEIEEPTKMKAGIGHEGKIVNVRIDKTGKPTRTVLYEAGRLKKVTPMNYGVVKNGDYMTMYIEGRYEYGWAFYNYK